MMGNKGARYSEDVGEFAEQIVVVLAPLGEVTWKKMFGGAGIFIDGSMFALVDTSARLHLKADDSNRARFESAGSDKHSRMPYWSVPDEVLADDERFLEWAGLSAALV